MMNLMEINGYRAVVQYDPEIDMFRGEFIGLNGGADFYATDIDGLRKEGEISLKVFLDMCREDGGVGSIGAHWLTQHRLPDLRTHPFQNCICQDDIKIQKRLPPIASAELNCCERELLAQ
jgi:hypothetical protein